MFDLSSKTPSARGQARPSARCPDDSLHVLGTVAKSGGGFLEAVEGLGNVEVLEIDVSSRDSRCDLIAERFAAALRAGGAGSVGGATRPVAAASAEGAVGAAAAPPVEGPAAEAPRPSEAPPAAEAAATPPTKRPAPEADEARLVKFDAAGLKVRFDNPGKGKFSSIYLKDPGDNFASVNAGDYMLYVGGAAINKAFQEALQACGHAPKDKYVTLHEALLARAKRAPGVLCRLSSCSARRQLLLRAATLRPAGCPLQPTGL
ncbi:unnamed protein product [Prorocentrum cordatum]|uniref:Uncharacterized protein n=1 Tax=Prorocentrum cordatum TaxID=2364126 RepID=A0ABN9QSZ5_9DINO|nr:unnamed protein product [Polarella glacialis]